MENVSTETTQNKISMDSGLRFYDVPSSPTNWWTHYSYDELAPENPEKEGFKKGDMIRVYRPATFFNDEILKEAYTIPITNDHPGRFDEGLVTTNNSRIHTGVGFEPYVKDNTLYLTCVHMYDNKAIADYNSGKKELSVGYMPGKGIWKTDSEGTFLEETIVRLNHISQVSEGRAGHNYRLHKKPVRIETTMNEQANIKEALIRINNKLDGVLTSVRLNSEDDRKDRKADADEEHKDGDSEKEKKVSDDEAHKDEARKDEDSKKEKKVSDDEARKDEDSEKEKKASDDEARKDSEDELKKVKEEKDTLARKNDVFMQERHVLLDLMKRIPQNQLAGWIDNDEFTTQEKITAKNLSESLFKGLEKKAGDIAEKSSRLNAATNTVAMCSYF